MRAIVGAVVLDHPAVVTFLFDHGIDLRETPIWKLDWVLDPTTTVEREEPLQLTASFALEGAELRMTLDEALEVLDWSRTDADAPAR